jgi:cell wall-associated NlpC family hydrolase
MLMTGRFPSQRLMPIVVLCACLFAVGCISSTVRFSAAQQKKPEPSKPAKEGEKKPEPVDDDDFGALLDDPAGPTPSPAAEGLSGEGLLLKTVAEWLGTPYHYSGMSKAGVDCSGLVCLIFRELGDYSLPHSSKEMVKLGSRVPLSKVKKGDLLFFHNGIKRVDHVGIYLGNDEFVHASSKLGVIKSSMRDESYRSRFIEARRILP